MAKYDYDLFTIGAGSGGVRASRLSAGFGARVAVAEERYLGGTCVNVGCIPKKFLVYASQFAEEVHEATHGYGWSMEPASFHWPTLIANKDREIERLNGIYRRILEQSGCEILEGRATVADPHTVIMGDRRYTAEHILVATGGWPSLPPIPGIEHAISSNEAFYLPELPPRVLVVGGGYIAVEFAGIFHGLGARVTEIYRGPLFLRGFDEDIRQGLAEAMRAKGIDLRFDLNIESIEKLQEGLRARLTDGSELEVDQILFATGRHPNSAGLGLTEAGAQLDQSGAVVVDEYSRTSVPSIHAIGDLTDRIALTPVALHEGICLANTLFNDRPMRPEYENVASAVFSQPNIGSVGLTEEEARTRYGEIDVYRSSFRPLKQTLTGNPEKSIAKILVDHASDRVVGLHVLGHDAGEIVQGFAVALKCGATKAQLDATIGIHPTFAEELVTLREPVAK